MKPYRSIEIKECDDPLVAIPTTEFSLEYPSAYQKLGADYGDKSPYYLRQQVLNKLLQAKQELNQIEPNWQFKIFDAYRPIAIQKYMVEHTFSAICQEKSLNPQQLTEKETEDIYQEVYKLWAIPSHNNLTPPPHSTGSAIDLTFMTEDGIEIDMGGEIDELSPRSHPNYYQNNDHPQSSIFHSRRQLLQQVMTKMGFRRHPEEWWHFSYGDQLWAWLENQSNPQTNTIAIYGNALNINKEQKVPL